MSYITGSHALKVGVYNQSWYYTVDQITNHDISYTFNNRNPTSLTQVPPFRSELIANPDLGAYVNDQWTVRKLTLNLGLRFDWYSAHSAEFSLPANQYLSARTFPRVDNIPNWKDLNPRVGVAYDLFGNGQTAIKGALGRYVADDGNLNGGNTPSANAPINSYINSVTRQWNDANRDYVPDCDLRALTANRECGQVNNLNFGRAVATRTYDPNLLKGWGKRGYNWEGSIALQHELRPGVGMNIAYYRRWFGNFTVADNVLIGAADFDPYCITAPVDTRLPGGGGNQICGLYDIKPTSFSLNQTVIKLDPNRTEVFQGIDVAIRQRSSKGEITAGLSTGQTVADICNPVDSPQARFCHTTNPFSASTQLKLNAIYSLPWNTQVSGTLQHLPGLSYTASYVATNALIRPSLGRNLGACGVQATCNGTATVELVEPFTQLEPRNTQIDVRLTRTFNLPHNARLHGRFDVYNLLNASPVIGEVTRYGSVWRQPTAILGARMFKFGFEFNF